MNSNNFENFESLGGIDYSTERSQSTIKEAPHKIGQSEQVNLKQPNQHKLPLDHIIARNMVIIN